VYRQDFHLSNDNVTHALQKMDQAQAQSVFWCINSTPVLAEKRIRSMFGADLVCVTMVAC